MKNVRSVQVIPKQRGVPQLQGNKAREAKRGQSNPAQPLLIPACSKTTQSHSLQLSFLPRLPVGQWVSCQTKGIMQVIEHHSRYETQLIPPLRVASENKLMARVKDNQCTFSIGRLWQSCSQQEPISSVPDPGCSSCATWVRASRVPFHSYGISPQRSLMDRYYKAQPTSDTNQIVNLLLYNFYRFYLFFPMANKYTKTKEDWPDSLRLCLFNHRII